MSTARRPAASPASAAPHRDDGDTTTLAVMVNVVTAYQRLRLRADERTLTVDTPIAWLGVVPHGRRVIRVPRHELADARIGLAVFPSRLAVAVTLAALPWTVAVPVALAVVCTVAAFLQLLLSVVASIHLETDGGDRHVVPVCWLERRAVRSFLADLVREDGP